MSLFQRNYDGNRLVRDEVVLGAEWVLAGEGLPTRKWDGTACMVRDGRLYKRYSCRRGGEPPALFEPAEPRPDPNTGHWPGWVPVGDGPEDQWHREAWERQTRHRTLEDGTYELCGPKVQGGREGFHEQFHDHVLLRHGDVLLMTAPRDYAGLKAFLRPGEIEGIVWHHPDGRMVKIKARDFGWLRAPMGQPR